MEYESILNGSYGYCKEKVKLTGFPRYDNLENKPQKQIVFMPTWISSLIIKAIENDCVIEEYLQRINEFYAYNDKNNCKRVYEEILKI